MDRVARGADAAGTPLEWRLVAAFGAVTVLVHFLTNGAYGYFRDELYFVACGEHLAWGYVDLPPMVAFVARLSRTLLGDSLFALRFFPALAGGATVALSGILAWELGGGRFAQALAMLATLAAPIYLGSATILTMNAFEPVFWMGGAWAVLRALKGGDPRVWLLFGLWAGLGLENKESILFFGFGVAAGLALTPARKVFAEKWFWLGGLVALALFMPTLVWQAAHGFPMLEELANVKASTKNAPVTWLGFFGAQVLMLGPLAFPIWAAGLYYFFAAERGREFRALGWAYLVIYASFVMLKGKVYYLAPFYPVLLGAGAVLLEELSEHRWRVAIRWALPALVVAEGILAAPLAMPVLPVETFIRYQRALGVEPPRTETRKLAELPQLYADMFGWENMVATVAGVYNGLPPAERAEAAIYASNYGEAGAIDFFGPRLGLPKAISGHMSYFLWGPGNYNGQVVIVIGGDEARYRSFFKSVERAATITSRYAMPDENDLPVFVCRDSRLPPGRLWPTTKRYL